MTIGFNLFHIFAENEKQSMTNIFIANLDWEISSDDLMATFSSFGKVAYAHVVFDKQTKKSKGFGYVEMETADGAIAAIQALNGMEINGRKLDVKIASPKENRPVKLEQKPTDSNKAIKKPFNPNYKPRKA
jgi:cold-inducible RNA-binding protein